MLKLISGTLSKAHSTDAGFDIHSAETIVIPPLDSASISTNLRISLPENSFGLVKSRSGLSFKHSLEVGAGVIDETYSGEIKVHLYNHGKDPYKISKDDKIAQLIVLPVLHPELYISQDANYTPPIDQLRSEKGFGSSGI